MESILVTILNFWNGAHSTIRGSLILVAGLFGAWLLKKIVEAILSLLRFDKAADRVGIGEFLRKGGVPHRPTKLVGAIFGWIGILAALLATSRTLDIAFVNQFADNLIATLPGALAAIIVIIVGIIIVTFLGNVVETIARNAAWPSAHLVSRVVRYFGATIVLLMAFDQLGLGKSILGWLLVMAFGAIALAFALAFGFGGQGLAKEALENLVKSLRERDRSEDANDLER